VIGRPSLLMLTAAAAGAAIVANGVTAATPADPSGQTRLGSAIQSDMASRDQAAAQRTRALDLREQAARAAEQRLQNELSQQQGGPNGKPGANGQPASEDPQYDDLARIYQAMKPAKAALVFEQLDMDVQMKVAPRMRERSTALILAAMTPRGAAALSMALARKNAAQPVAVPAVAARAPRPAPLGKPFAGNRAGR